MVAGYTDFVAHTSMSQIYAYCILLYHVHKKTKTWLGAYSLDTFLHSGITPVMLPLQVNKPWVGQLVFATQRGDSATMVILHHLFC
jgi:hypothetical protein